MSQIKVNKVQIGQSATATQNFSWEQPASPDGTVKLARGNSGATTQDILTVDASGNVNAPVGIQKNGSALQALSDFTGSNVSLAASGYQKLPSGLIIQWGATGVITGGSSVAVTFPIAFPNACLNASATYTTGTNTTTPSAGSLSSLSTTGITVRNLGATSNPIYWLVIGY